MKTLHDIQSDIGALSAEERATLISWLLDADRQVWDEQISQDFSTGGAGMKLLVDVDDQIRNGGFRPME